MSRIGKQPIPIPSGVTVSVKDNVVSVEGKAGKLTQPCHENMIVRIEDDPKQIVVERPNDQRANRELHGLTRSLIANMVQGVQEPFQKQLEVHGVGYTATQAGTELKLQVGFANTIVKQIPAIVTCDINKQGVITLTSPDKQAVGQFAAEVRAARPPEPYKGKGIRYAGEQVRRKAGKADAGKK